MVFLKKNLVKNLNVECKRYQHEILKLSNTEMIKMVQNYLRTLSWLGDYYMNTDYESTSSMISTWSYNYDRSPFLQHIASYLQSARPHELERLMKGFYQRSLVSTDNYLKTDRHKFYIYPQSSNVITKIPNEYKDYFPDMSKYIATTLDLYNANNSENDITVFDCRMCPYFSKCIFKSRHITFKQLLDIDYSTMGQ